MNLSPSEKKKFFLQSLFVLRKYTSIRPGELGSSEWVVGLQKKQYKVIMNLLVKCHSRKKDSLIHYKRSEGIHLSFCHVFACYQPIWHPWLTWLMTPSHIQSSKIVKNVPFPKWGQIQFSQKPIWKNRNSSHVMEQVQFYFSTIFQLLEHYESQ